VLPPSLAGGCQRCTCANNIWQCACSMRHRKEVNDLTNEEFDLFARALNHMQSTGEWKDVARTHAASDRQHYKTHMNNHTFLPWHRKFLVEVENRLQIAAVHLGSSTDEACGIAFPYWNWALDKTNFASSRIFGDDRLGALTNGASSGDLDDQFCVKTGKFGQGVAGSQFGNAESENPFKGGWFGLEGCGQLNGIDASQEMLRAFNWRSWQVPCNRPEMADGGCSDCILRRGVVSTRSLPSLNYPQMLNTLQNEYPIHNFGEMSNFLEGQIHNSFHSTVGGEQRINGVRSWGHMMSMYSPYDPIFFFHHGFIDYLWSQWQNIHVEGPWRDTSGGGHLLNNLLWDGNADVFPASDVALSMDIKDDDVTTSRMENVCVKHHERETNHACAPRWTEIQTCLSKLVDHQLLHSVPRIRTGSGVGDVCDPLADAHWDLDRMWLETMSASGMMSAEDVDTVLSWEATQLRAIENTTEVVDISDDLEHCHADHGSEEANLAVRESDRCRQHACDKTLCFSVEKMLSICNACEAEGVAWSARCHCEHSAESTSCS